MSAGGPTHAHGVEDEVSSTGVSTGLTDSSVRSWYTLTKLIYSHGFHGSSYGPRGPDATRAEISPPWLHIVSFNRKASLAFLQRTPCLISILPTPPFVILPPFIHPSALWEPRSTDFSSSYCQRLAWRHRKSIPLEPCVSMRDARSEIIRSFISVGAHGSVCDLLGQVFL